MYKFEWCTKYNGKRGVEMEGKEKNRKAWMSLEVGPQYSLTDGRVIVDWNIADEEFLKKKQRGLKTETLYEVFNKKFFI